MVPYKPWQNFNLGSSVPILKAAGFDSGLRASGLVEFDLKGLDR
jgi:hypothetical protein